MRREREREGERERLANETLRLLSREKICRISEFCQLRSAEPAETRHDEGDPCRRNSVNHKGDSERNTATRRIQK
jgi:hypothetical protein